MMSNDLRSLPQEMISEILSYVPKRIMSVLSKYYRKVYLQELSIEQIETMFKRLLRSKTHFHDFLMINIVDRLTNRDLREIFNCDNKDFVKKYIPLILPRMKIMKKPHSGRPEYDVVAFYKTMIPMYNRTIGICSYHSRMFDDNVICILPYKNLFITDQYDMKDIWYREHGSRKINEDHLILILSDEN